MNITDNPAHTALVLGATGGIGGEAARKLHHAGWQVRALYRQAPAAGEYRDGIHWLRGDAMNPGDVMRAARGCGVIVHAVNPPGYRRWAELVLPMIDNSIRAAVAENATIMLPGTVYNYGPDAFPLLNEDAPQHPLTRKGAIRVELERRLQAAADRGAQAIVVRAGDFFGPRAGNTWFSQGVIKPGRAVTVINSPGKAGIGHQWCYLPDIAETMAALLARRETLSPFSTFHMAGHWDDDGMQMAHAIRRVVMRHGGQPALRAFPWWLTSLLAPVVPTLRELQEMRYLWRQPVRLDNSRLQAMLGSEPHTPLELAVETTLMGLGCLTAH
ncbi:NAD-dependent epimerase/dehydratase family protein [Sodalis sp. RH22]|uniref:NAD-dependent epimerase/dehydratase family protein n=1 Tax=unclassified Sodalis (in: enterobacteria) TaxID=2636512 RepID=UPI0039B36D1D